MDWSFDFSIEIYTSTKLRSIRLRNSIENSIECSIIQSNLPPEAEGVRRHSQRREAFGAARCPFHHNHRHHGKQIMFLRGHLFPGSVKFRRRKICSRLEPELRGQRIGSTRAVALSVCLLMANLIGKPWLVVGSFYSFVYEKFGGREKEGGHTGRTADDV